MSICQNTTSIGAASDTVNVPTSRQSDTETCSQCGAHVGGGENCILAMKNRQKNRPKRPESDIDIDIELDFYEPDAGIEGIGRCFARIGNIRRQFLLYQ